MPKIMQKAVQFGRLDLFVRDYLWPTSGSKPMKRAEELGVLIVDELNVVLGEVADLSLRSHFLESHV